MKALLFAAGLGTRIQEISKGKPKALVVLNNKELIVHAIEYLHKNKIEEVIVNIHHQSKMMIDFISNYKFPIPVTISDESDLLLDTGGGLLNVKDFFKSEDTFVIYNVDVLTNLDLSKMFEFHKATNALASLAVRDRNTSRYLLFNKNNKMIGWENVGSGEKILHSSEASERLAFSGIHILSTKIFSLLEDSERIFSITKSYIKLSKEYLIQGYVHDNDYWFDVGKPESYYQAEKFLLKY